MALKLDQHLFKSANTGSSQDCPREYGSFGMLNPDLESLPDPVIQGEI